MQTASLWTISVWKTARRFLATQSSEPFSGRTGTDLSKLAGRPVRLRMLLKDADLYSFQFEK